MSARPEHLSGRFSPHDWQEIQRRDIPVPGISSGPLGTGKVVTAEDASRHLEAAREAEELLRLQAAQQAVSSEPINLTELAGSSPLANLSLDPFAFTPDTGVEVPTVFANKGGAVMPGLGFRPLGYFEGGTADKLWSEFDAVTKSDLTKAEMAGYIYQNLGDLEMIAAENPSRAQMLESVKQWSDFDAFIGLMNRIDKGMLKMKNTIDAINTTQKAAFDRSKANTNALSMTDDEIIRANSTGLIIYNPKNLADRIKGMANTHKTREQKIAERHMYIAQNKGVDSLQN